MLPAKVNHTHRDLKINHIIREPTSIVFFIIHSKYFITSLLPPQRLKFLQNTCLYPAVSERDRTFFHADIPQNAVNIIRVTFRRILAISFSQQWTSLACMLLFV